MASRSRSRSRSRSVPYSRRHSLASRASTSPETSYRAYSQSDSPPRSPHRQEEAAEDPNAPPHAWPVPILYPISKDILAEHIRSNDPRYLTFQPHPKIIPHLLHYHKLHMICFTPVKTPDPTTTTPKRVVETYPFNLEARLAALSTQPDFFLKHNCFFSESLPDVDAHSYKLIKAGVPYNLRTPSSEDDTKPKQIIDGAVLNLLEPRLFLLQTKHKGMVASLSANTVWNEHDIRHNPYIELNKPEPGIHMRDITYEDVALAYLHLVVEKAHIKLKHCIYQSESAIYIDLDLLKILAKAGDLSTSLRIVHLDQADGTTIESTAITDNAFLRQCILHVDNTRDIIHNTIEIASPVTFSLGDQIWTADMSACRYANASCISAYITLQSTIGVQVSRLAQLSKRLTVDERALYVTHVGNAMVSFLARSKAFAHGVRYTSNAFKTYHIEILQTSIGTVRSILIPYGFLQAYALPRTHRRRSRLPIS